MQKFIHYSIKIWLQLKYRKMWKIQSFEGCEFCILLYYTRKCFNQISNVIKTPYFQYWLYIVLTWPCFVTRYSRLSSYWKRIPYITSGNEQAIWDWIFGFQSSRILHAFPWVELFTFSFDFKPRTRAYSYTYKYIGFGRFI
jgi:hypothetical protein